MRIGIILFFSNFLIRGMRKMFFCLWVLFRFVIGKLLSGFLRVYRFCWIILACLVFSLRIVIEFLVRVGKVCLYC